LVGLELEKQRGVIATALLLHDTKKTRDQALMNAELDVTGIKPEEQR